MIKYRPHRGGLDDSMNEYKEFNDIADMLRFIEKDTDGLVKTTDIVISESYGEDFRVDWKSWRYVCTIKYGQEDYIKRYGTPQCIGMCDLGEGDKQ